MKLENIFKIKFCFNNIYKEEIEESDDGIRRIRVNFSKEYIYENESSCQLRFLRPKSVEDFENILDFFSLNFKVDNKIDITNIFKLFLLLRAKYKTPTQTKIDLEDKDFLQFVDLLKTNQLRNIQKIIYQNLFFPKNINKEIGFLKNTTAFIGVQLGVIELIKDNFIKNDKNSIFEIGVYKPEDSTIEAYRGTITQNEKYLVYSFTKRNEKSFCLREDFILNKNFSLNSFLKTKNTLFVLWLDELIKLENFNLENLLFLLKQNNSFVLIFNKLTNLIRKVLENIVDIKTNKVKTITFKDIETKIITIPAIIH